jgi:8-oxo-dGTP diphosphatase
VKFHFLARGIVFLNGKVLLAHMKGADNTFLPGGHIELGERAETALLREIREEIGKDAVVRRFVGAVECAYPDAGQEHHEINLLFELQVPGLDPNHAPESHESHLEFLWSLPEELTDHYLLPAPMIDCLAAWEHGYRGDWGSDFRGMEGEK